MFFFLLWIVYFTTTLLQDTVQKYQFKKICKKLTIKSSIFIMKNFKEREIIYEYDWFVVCSFIVVGWLVSRTGGESFPTAAVETWQARYVSFHEI